MMNERCLSSAVCWAQGSAVVRGWGSARHGRAVRVSMLDAEQRAALDAGRLWLYDCPPAVAGRSGTTWRRVVKAGRRWYARVPSVADLARLEDGGAL